MNYLCTGTKDNLKRGFWLVNVNTLKILILIHNIGMVVMVVLHRCTIPSSFVLCHSSEHPFATSITFLFDLTHLIVQLSEVNDRVGVGKWERREDCGILCGTDGV